MSKLKSTSVEVRLPSRLGFEKVAMGTAASVAKLMGFREDRVEDLKTAIAEACINAIEHGNKFNESLSVAVMLTMDDTTLEVKVVDKGEGMSHPVSPPDNGRKMDGEEGAPGIRIFLKESVVSEIELVPRSANGGSSYVRLVIRLDAAGAQ